MKAMKKVFAIVCALAMVLSMVTVAQAAELDRIPLSLAITDNGDNTVTVDVKTTDATFKSACAYIKVPVELKDYITGWDITTYPSEGSPTVTAPVYPGYVTGSVFSQEQYIQVGINWDAANLLKPVDGKIASVKLTLKEGGVPENVNRTLTLGCEYKGTQSNKRKGGSYFGPADTGSMFYFVNTADATETPGTPSNTVAYDPTAEGNYVVVPAAGGNDEPAGPVINGYVGDTDATDEAVGAYYEFTAPEAGATGIKWTVEPKEGESKWYVSTVNVAGGATYKFGLVIQGLAESAVKSITAVLQ